MMKAFHALTDDEVAGHVSMGDIASLAARYRELRDHHVAETEALTKRDRSAILRMAGNIAGGLCADPEWQGDPAETAVAIARQIVAEVDQ
jgi:hypothetical protein